MTGPDGAAITIERIRGDELREVAAFVNECWREAYDGILDAGFLARLTTHGRAARLQAKLDAGGAVLVARDPGLCGMVLIRSSHFPDHPEAGEISALYLRADRIGQGLGHRLFVLAEEALAARGYDEFVLDVFEANERAVRFYTAHGYRKVGSKVDDFDGRTYPLAIMARRIGAVRATVGPSEGSRRLS